MPDGQELFRVAHPFQFAPYLYESYSPKARAVLKTAYGWIRILRVDPSTLANITFTEPPDISGHILFPANGATIAVCPFKIEADVTAPAEVAWVRFRAFYDNVWHDVATDTDGADGWSALFDCSRAPTGTITLTIWVQDKAGSRMMDPGVVTNVVLTRPTK